MATRRSISISTDGTITRTGLTEKELAKELAIQAAKFLVEDLIKGCAQESFEVHFERIAHHIKKSNLE